MLLRNLEIVGEQPNFLQVPNHSVKYHQIKMCVENDVHPFS